MTFKKVAIGAGIYCAAFALCYWALIVNADSLPV